MRPARFQINRNHPLANGLKLAWLGYLPGGDRSFSSDPYNFAGTKAGNVYWSRSSELDRHHQVYDGSGDYVELTNSKYILNFIKNTWDATISAWVKFAYPAVRNPILASLGNSTRMGFQLEFCSLSTLNFTTKQFRMYRNHYTGSTGQFICDYISPQNTITDTNWHHVMVVCYRDSGINKAKFFVDGVDLGGANGRASDYSTLSTGNDTFDTRIGHLQDYSVYYTGSIADVIVWNRGLGASAAWLLSRKDPMVGGLIEPIGGIAYPYAPDQIASYTLIAGTGSFSLSGQGAALQASRILPVAAGSFALSGTAADFGITMPAGAGGYSLAGQDIIFLKSLILSAGNGSFELSGTSTGLLSSRLIAAGSGSFSLTGQDVALLQSLILAAETGEFLLSGQQASLLISLLLHCDSGSFGLAGAEATLLRLSQLPVDSGSFTLDGQAADLLVSRMLPAASGSFALTGSAASLLASRLIPCGGGAFVLVGQDASLIFSPNGTYTLVAGSGSFTLTGQDASLLVSRIVAAEPGSFSFIGQPVSLLRSLRLIAATGSFLLNGQEVQLVYTPVGTFHVYRGRIIGMVGSGAAKSRQIGGN